MKMKNLLYFAFGLLIVFSLSFCKSSTEGETDGQDSTATEIEVEEAFLCPADVDPGQPIPVAQLLEAVLAWNDQVVTINGYCNFFFDKGKIADKVSLKPHPDSTREMVECTMIQMYDEEFEKKTPVTIKGKISRDFFGKIILTECELISKNEKAVSVGKINPAKLPEKPIPVEEFFKAFYGWMNKEVSVIGYYHSTTTSTTSYGTTIRVDLSDPETGEKCVGCEMKTDPSDQLVNNRENVVIKGIIKGEVFGNVSMENCDLVK